MFAFQAVINSALCDIILLYIQEQIRADLRYTIIGTMFIFESFGFVIIMCLMFALNDNWRLTYGVIVFLFNVLLICSFFMTESYGRL